MRPPKSTWLAFWICFSVQTAFGQDPQRDAPLLRCYLSPIEAEEESGQLTLKFDLRKLGGPHEHTEYQCYLLMYLQKDESAIRKTLSDPAALKKANQSSRPFLHEWIDSGLVMELKTQVATMSDTEQSGRRYPFQFDLKLTDIFNQLEELKHFSAMNAEQAGKTKSYRDEIRFAVFVPVNDSMYATEIEPKLRESHDFSGAYDYETSVLLFKTLPYRFKLIRYTRNNLGLVIQ